MILTTLRVTRAAIIAQAIEQGENDKNLCVCVCVFLLSVPQTMLVVVVVYLF
jgi:hypothetical protein